MSEQLVSRPCVTDLMFQVFDRPVHPELIESLLTWGCEREGYQLKVCLTSAGHLVEWRWNGLTLAEVLCEQSHPLPEHRQLFAHRVGSERSERQTPSEKVTYQTCFQVERLPEQIFWHIHDEFRRDGERNGLFHCLRPNDRLGLAPISYVDLQARAGSLIVHVYHTYPDEFAIVKTQSLIEIA